MKLMQAVDTPWTPAHIIWHFIMSALMLIDGLLGVLSLGLRHPSFSHAWVDGGGNWIFDHNAKAEKEWQETQTEIKQAIAKELGIDPERMVEMDPSDVEAMILKSMRDQLENSLFNKQDDEETYH